MLTRTQALEGGANVTRISKVQITYHSFIRLTILGQYATFGIEAEVLGSSPPARKNGRFTLRRITSE